MRRLRLVLPALVAVTATAACGGADGATVQTADELPAAQEATTTTAATTTTPTTNVPATTLPGEEFDPIFTPAGVVLDAVGIAFDETLDVRAVPGSDGPVVASLPPLSGGIESQGRARLLENDGVWLEVTADGTTGWIDSSEVARLGGARDVTADVVASTGGTPTAPSMLELAQVVDDVVVPSDPAAPPAEIVVAAAPSGAPTDEVVSDVFPGEFFGDDTSIGFRIVVVGRQVTAGSLPETGFASGVVYELVRADIISMCTRGVTDDGLCV